MKTIISFKPGRAVLIFSVLLLLATLLGCSAAPPTISESPTSVASEIPLPAEAPIFIRNDVGVAFIRLPDGSEIYLSEYTDIELITVAGLTMGATEDEIVIHRGQIAVNSHLPAGKWFTIKNPNGFIARVTGSTIVVTYSPETGQFNAACVEGDCQMGPEIQQLLQVAADAEGWLDQDGNFNGPFEVNLEELEATYGSWIVPTEEATPTYTSSPQMASETPLPYTQTPNAAATATSACATFRAQFPGTPCP